MEALLWSQLYILRNWENTMLRKLFLSLSILLGFCMPAFAADSAALEELLQRVCTAPPGTFLVSGVGVYRDDIEPPRGCAFHIVFTYEGHDYTWNYYWDEKGSTIGVCRSQEDLIECPTVLYDKTGDGTVELAFDGFGRFYLAKGAIGEKTPEINSHNLPYWQDMYEKAIEGLQWNLDRQK